MAGIAGHRFSSAGILDQAEIIMTRYPLLNRLSPVARIAALERAEAGLPLLPEQVAALGLFPCRLILTPVDGNLTEAQVSNLFAGDRSALAFTRKDTQHAAA